MPILGIARSQSLWQRASVARCAQQERRIASRFAASALTLPAFSPGVPAISVKGKAQPTIFAECLAELGVLQRKHWKGDIAKSVKAALRDLDKLKSSGLHIDYTDDLSAYSGAGCDFCVDSAREELSYNGPIGAILFFSNNPSWWLLGDTLERLEGAKNGLGETILAILETSLCRGLGAVTPTAALYMAQHHYWMGEDDETLDREEWLESAGPNAKPEDYGGFTRAEFDQSFPKWAIHPEVKLTLSTEVSPNGGTLAETFGEFPAIIAAATDLQEYSRTSEANNLPRDSTRAFDKSNSEILVPFILRWSKRDAMVRITDDIHEQECHCAGEINPAAYTIAFPMDDRNQVRAALSHIPTIFELTRRAEALIALIGKPENRSRT